MRFDYTSLVPFLNGAMSITGRPVYHADTLIQVRDNLHRLHIGDIVRVERVNCAPMGEKANITPEKFHPFNALLVFGQAYRIQEHPQVYLLKDGTAEIEVAAAFDPLNPHYIRRNLAVALENLQPKNPIAWVDLARYNEQLVLWNVSHSGQEVYQEAMH